MIAAVADADTDVRTRAAWALSEIGDGAAIPALRAALAKENDADARKAEVRALIHSGERSERLTELLESKDPEVRAAAIRGVAGGDGVDPWPWPEPRPRPFPVSANTHAPGASYDLRHGRPAPALGRQQWSRWRGRWRAVAGGGGRSRNSLADEPTGNLDSTNGAAVIELLRELHTGGATICMVIHDPRYATRAERIVRLLDGRIVEGAVESADAV